MKKRAGIFDPWRQEPTPLSDEESPLKRKTIDTSRDTTSVAPETCIQFVGFRAGLFVWLVLEEGERDYSALARKTLVDFLYRLFGQDVFAKILREWGIHLGAPEKCPKGVVVDGGERKITIAVVDDDIERAVPQAIDAVSLALRELAQQFPDIQDSLQALKLKPFVK